jgi:hypothetical protein
VVVSNDVSVSFLAFEALTVFLVVLARCVIVEEFPSTCVYVLSQSSKPILRHIFQGV